MTDKRINVARSLSEAVTGVTKSWAKQRRAEERDRGAVHYRRMRLVRAPRITIREAAFSVMGQAYLKASDGDALPARPRQIMYAARPEILAITSDPTLDDRYFTQTLLPDYMNENPNTADWDVVWDARGHFLEPHTGKEVPLGTLEVREYLGLRAQLRDTVSVEAGLLYPTHGPEQRYGAVLFVEKEGFGPLFKAAQLAERYDLAIMSTKGMSVSASRMLLQEVGGGDQLGDAVDSELPGDEVDQLARRHRIEFDPLMLQERDLGVRGTMPPQCGRTLAPVARHCLRLGLESHRLGIGEPQAEIDQVDFILEPIAPAVGAERAENREPRHIEIMQHKEFFDAAIA